MKGKHIATCGHEVEGGGISFTTNGWSRDCREVSDYSTYCAKCVAYILNDYEENCYELRDTEILKLRKLLKE